MHVHAEVDTELPGCLHLPAPATPSRFVLAILHDKTLCGRRQNCRMVSIRTKIGKAG